MKKAYRITLDEHDKLNKYYNKLGNKLKKANNLLEKFLEVNKNREFRYSIDELLDEWQTFLHNITELSKMEHQVFLNICILKATDLVTQLEE